jgi:LacI family transcriptional regulator
MVINDAQASPLFQALEQMELSVPNQVAVIGSENIKLLCEMSRVPLTSVETNHQEMGYQAAALLDQLMDGQPAPAVNPKVTPGPVIYRESTNILATENSYTEAALRFIWDHYRENITVADVAKTAPISRRRLQTVFRDDIGRTLQEEIIRVRVEAACKLLEKRNLKIFEIAALSGFAESLHMHRAFTNAFGFGPRAYADNGRPKGNLPQPCPLY